MATRLIGSGTTDSQGKININYTGTGAGKLQLIAKQGNLLSETYELLDALFYDKATSNEKASTHYADVTVNRSYSNYGTTLYYTADSGTKYCNTVIGDTKNWFDSTNKYQIELDFSFERGDSSSAVGIGIGSNGYNIHNWFSGALTGSGHLKIITNGATWQPYVDGVAKGSAMSINGTNGLFFQIYRTGSFTFKDLKIWEI